MSTDSARISSSSSSQEESPKEESLLNDILTLLELMNTVDSPLVKFVAKRMKTDEQLAHLLTTTTLIKFKTTLSSFQEDYNDDYPSVTIARYSNLFINGAGVDALTNLICHYFNLDEEVVTAGLNYFVLTNRKLVEKAEKVQEEEREARKARDEEWERTLKEEMSQAPINFDPKPLIDRKMLSDIYSEFSEIGAALSQTFTEAELETKFKENVFYQQILAGYKLANYELQAQ